MAAKDYLFNPDRNPLFRDDYRPSEYRIPKASLDFELDAHQTTVKSKLLIERNPNAAQQGGPLILDGTNIKLKSLEIIENGNVRALDPSEFMVTDKHLIIKHPPSSAFELKIETECDPAANTSLSGLYESGGLLTTQCEAQGFRNITYFIDRPDNLTQFDVTLTADKAAYPVLLSNGNGDFTTAKDLGDGRHQVAWIDPWPKPSYLFALVAGDMKYIEDTFTTMSGKKVDLRIFVEPGYEDKIDWAMESIKRSMKWDEDRYGREYDLDCFHVVATDKFNAGAMENKGLNIFNTKLLVGDPDTSTDTELEAIEAVIAHEYFHNWTGNRVTLRDWFELTLKEGLTVLRDRQFTEDMHSKTVKQIDDATDLRARQFSEDSSPSAHPIRPDRVEVFENIYTGTIYEKGSHVLGMLHTMMGEQVWRLAMDEYFNRFDGQAVACDNFVDVMEEVSGIDLTQFRLWYSQAGTPEVAYKGGYDAATRTYTLMLAQSTPPTHGQSTKENLHIPVAVGLISQSGKDIPLKLQGDTSGDAPTTKVLHLKDKVQTFVFEDVDGPVVPSILRGFSAPVKIVTDPSEEDLIFRMSHDSDGFNKYEAAERLMIKTFQSLLQQHVMGQNLSLPRTFIDAYQTNLQNALDGDVTFNALLLGMPSITLLTSGLPNVNPDDITSVMKYMRETMGTMFRAEYRRIYEDTTAPDGEKHDMSQKQVGRRQMHNLALSYLGATKQGGILDLAKIQYANASNMTERIAALGTMIRFEGEAGDKALDDFYAKHKANTNLVDKWLTLKASQNKEDSLAHMQGLLKHEAFDITNPNKVRALVGGFVTGNYAAFHKKDGSGYKFLADLIIELNDVNPKIGAGLSNILCQYKRYDEGRQALMLGELSRIMKTPGLESGIKEIVGKALEMAEKKPANQNNMAFGKASKKA